LIPITTLFGNVKWISPCEPDGLAYVPVCVSGSNGTSTIGIPNAYGATYPAGPPRTGTSPRMMPEAISCGVTF